jgi:3'(2'), 5'-bisphosphate nucleotidase
MYERELETALQAARLAGQHLLQEYARFQPIPDAPADISTEADRSAQEIILQSIHDAFPEDALSAEEATPTLQRAQNAQNTGDRLWIVDPIDGTRGFARKNGEFSVMIAFVERGHIAVGVVAQPTAEKLTYASRGQGCWRLDRVSAQPVRCQVTTVNELRRCTLTQSRSRGMPSQSKWALALEPAKVVECYSAGIKLAMVARGDADVYLNSYEAFHDWDICAGHILVTEAGGSVTGIGAQDLRYGLPDAWQRDGLLASNGHLHQAALAVILSTCAVRKN